jgi:hypothetical protein
MSSCCPKCFQKWASVPSPLEHFPVSASPNDLSIPAGKANEWMDDQQL